ncbi:MAG: BamA/TamA family outer membrane protein [Pseudomonadota bacterium]
MKTGILGGMSFAAVAFLATATFSQQALEAGERVFTSIEVTGNKRFRDGDVLATADLRPGEPYTEEDIAAAIEALEFTGEFRDIRIFSQGDTLTIAVIEEADYSGNLTFGIGADSDIGLFGTAGVELENVLGGNAFSFDLTFSKEVVIARSALTGDSFWPGDLGGGVRLEYADYDYDDTLFNFQTGLIQPFVTFGENTENFQGEVRLNALWTDISSVDPDASAIIQAEAGDRFVAGPGVALKWTGAGAMPWTIGASVDIYGGDADFAKASLAFSTRFPVTDWSVLRLRASLGAVEGLGSSQTTAVDRLTLGGTSLRGFARGGVTPVDFCAGCGAGGANVTTSLGGERYVALQTDLLLPVFGSNLPFTPGLYFDVGKVWSVGRDTAPSGVLLDDGSWRSSAGIAVTAETQLGDFSASYALETQSEDFDDTERFTLSFISKF